MAIIVVAVFVVAVALAVSIVVVCTAREIGPTAVYALCGWVLGLFFLFFYSTNCLPKCQIGLRELEIKVFSFQKQFESSGVSD